MKGKNPGLYTKRGNPDLHDFPIIHTLKQKKTIHVIFREDSSNR